ncbi:MAG: carboxylate-amine ligase [Lysobacterales bacterium 69-70]|nr:carboxylate-amine ligase [Xanthomonadaceae bacterium]ODU33413.1 MAG: carboxylate-amine ligase [Xanthomonadaceae bacterium SCN 69-320]ODV17784.1 MAG: carboxylate-amine ligase [Xanthomonadaceae bacterium SCN 69-25]OJZ00954.1 MAG: carboxylate-amine ligase [Xanthomonadales bacterium 69-70]
MSSDYSIGVEEEFFLTETSSGLIVPQMPAGFVRACNRHVAGEATYELMQSQIETTTPVCRDPGELRQMLVALRTGLADVAADFGLSLVAAGTHPLGEWREQITTVAPRYERMIEDFQIIGRRNLLCGLHVHVAPPGGVDRVDVMNRIVPWLPLLLALSTSSPFWSRQDTGLASYRQAAYDEWPRTGIPDHFGGQAEYDAFVQGLLKAGVIPDASQLWWAIRPSARFPTLELRLCDSCTHVDDALCIAHLFRCLVRALTRQPEAGRARTPLTRMLVEENRWQAKRQGVRAQFVDEIHGGRREPLEDALQRLLDFIEPDIAHFGCQADARHARAIVRRGTSADLQRAIYRSRRDAGAPRREACQDVVRWLGEATRVSVGVSQAA